MIRKSGFSRIDAAVVAACIVWLVLCAGSVGSHGAAMAERAVCLAHMKRLTHAWLACAQDSGGYLPGGCPGKGTRPWLGQKSYSGDSTSSITSGALWPYSQDRCLYRCPRGRAGEVVTYSIVQSMNGAQSTSGSAGKYIRKLSDIPESTASGRMVFIDEGWSPSGGFVVFYDQHRWWDSAPARHDCGTCVSFADGHSEYWQWKDSRNCETSRPPETSHPSQNPPATTGYDEDLIRLQIAVWGELGYVLLR